MTDWLNSATAFLTDHRAETIAAACTLGVLLLSLAASMVWAAHRGRTLKTRAALLFAIVQAGVAAVTITGVYQFWHSPDKVGLPGWDAAGIAIIIEAVTWAAVADIFVWGDTLTNTGMGRSGPLFWAAVAGGGIMAILGSGSVSIALGRAVVVILGGNMWYVRIMQRTRRAATKKRTRLTVTPRQWMIRRGWLVADETDVVKSPREWQEMTLSRAVRQAADGGPVSSWLGKRAIQLVMESGDVDMVRAAQRRYALSRVLRDDLTPDSKSMAAAIAAARAALYPALADPTPAPAAVESPPAADEVAEAPSRPVARRRTVPDSRKASEQREAAVAEVVRELLANPGARFTSKGLGERYGLGEEWGRQRLVEARRKVAADAAPVNGRKPGPVG